MGIVDWRYAQLQRLAVDMRFNCYADESIVLNENPDIILVATGGTPNVSFLSSGEELVTTTWDVLSGMSRLHPDVLVYDDIGQHQGVSCAEFIGLKGSAVKLVTPDRTVAQEVGGTNYPVYLKLFDEMNVEVVVNQRLMAVQRNRNGLTGILLQRIQQSDY